MNILHDIFKKMERHTGVKNKESSKAKPRIRPETFDRLAFFDYKQQIHRYRTIGPMNLSDEHLRHYAQLIVLAHRIQAYHANNGDYDWRI
jgi:hypothetical protein